MVVALKTRSTEADGWSARLRQTLQSYDEALLRGVAARLFKPRNQWPVEELIERSQATFDNAAVIDRRLKELEPAQRQVLALIAHSRQPRWDLGNLIFLLMALGHPEGLPPILSLLEAGLLYPCLPESRSRLKNFEQWLGQAGNGGLAVFAHPAVTSRALGEELSLPELVSQKADRGTQEADGLDWPLRLTALWQQVSSVPLRRTQLGSLFKRDLDRLTLDPLIGGASAEGLAALPAPALLLVALAENQGILVAEDGELRAGPLPSTWTNGLPAVLESLWTALPHLTSWDSQNGWRDETVTARGNPYPSAYLLALLLLSRLPADGWADPAEIEQWLFENHPYWKEESVRPSQRRSWLPAFLLGFAYPLRMVQAARGPEGQWLVRLSAMGRWLLGFEQTPQATPHFAQTLLVQPNLEIVAYRQGLTPALIARLAHFADWKSFGAACTLQLRPESAYRALQTGLTYQDVLQTLERHGMKAVPPAVVESLRTWANKRERITVYPAATLFEFANADDLTAALARGLPGTRISDRLAIVPSENGVDFRDYRLAGSRDYSLPPEQCVGVEADGVTLTIDLSRSDLLVETELQRFAVPVEHSGSSARRQYRITPESVAVGRDGGLNLRSLEEWFQQRTGQPVSPAARLLMIGNQMPPGELRRRLVLYVAAPELADGLVQWPGTRALIEERLGPTALAVAEENIETLRERLAALGMTLQL